MLSNVAILMFAIFAVSYLVQLFFLVRALKNDNALWARLGKPSLMSLEGQRRFDRIIFHPDEFPITDKQLLKKIHITKALMFSGAASFIVAVAIFFMSGKAGSLPH